MDINAIENTIDLRLNLLFGDVLYTGDIAIKPLTLREILKIGYSRYTKMLSILTISKEEILKGEDVGDKSLIELVATSGSDTLIDIFAEALCLFLNENRDDLLVGSFGFVFGGKTKEPDECKVVSKANFNDLIQILKYQNGLVNGNESYAKPNPADEKAKAILNKLKKANEVLSKKKAEDSKDGNQIDFADIVSAVSTKSNTYNKHTVWDMTVYQLYDEYKRLEAISGYEINIQAMMQGAKIDNLKHWSASLD